MKIRLALVFALIGLITFSAGLGTYAWYQNTYTRTDDFTAADWVVTPTNIDEGLDYNQVLDLTIAPGDFGSDTFSVTVVAGVTEELILDVVQGGLLFDDFSPVVVTVNGTPLVPGLNSIPVLPGENSFTIAYEWLDGQILPDGSSTDNLYAGLSGYLDVELVVKQA